jgi:hypothetical protein
MQHRYVVLPPPMTLEGMPCLFSRLLKRSEKVLRCHPIFFLDHDTDSGYKWYYHCRLFSDMLLLEEVVCFG